MGIPKFKGFSKEKNSKKDKKKGQLTLVADDKHQNKADVLQRRKTYNLQEKSEITAYQDAINKTLDDPDMAKKAAMILLEMIENR